MDYADFSLSFDDPIDGISSNRDFNLLGVIQRRREAYSKCLYEIKVVILKYPF